MSTGSSVAEEVDSLLSEDWVPELHCACLSHARWFPPPGVAKVRAVFTCCNRSPELWCIDCREHHMTWFLTRGFCNTCKDCKATDLDKEETFIRFVPLNQE